MVLRKSHGMRVAGFLRYLESRVMTPDSQAAPLTKFPASHPPSAWIHGVSTFGTTQRTTRTRADPNEKACQKQLNPKSMHSQTFSERS